MHGNICDTHQVRHVSELKQCLLKVWQGLVRKTLVVVACSAA